MNSSTIGDTIAAHMPQILSKAWKFGDVKDKFADLINESIAGSNNPTYDAGKKLVAKLANYMGINNSPATAISKDKVGVSAAQKEIKFEDVKAKVLEFVGDTTKKLQNKVNNTKAISKEDLLRSLGIERIGNKEVIHYDGTIQHPQFLYGMFLNALMRSGQDHLETMEKIIKEHMEIRKLVINYLAQEARKKY